MYCRHCNERKANRPRNLCKTCYDVHFIRLSYPVPPPKKRTRTANKPPAVRRCARCDKLDRIKCRGLCYSCYMKHREHVPPNPKYMGKIGRMDISPVRPLPKPTQCPPGTPGKVAILEYRAANRLQLFHPADAIG